MLDGLGKAVCGRHFSQDRHTGPALQNGERPLPWDRATGEDV